MSYRGAAAGGDGGGAYGGGGDGAGRDGAGGAGSHVYAYSDAEAIMWLWKVV